MYLSSSHAVRTRTRKSSTVYEKINQICKKFDEKLTCVIEGFTCSSRSIPTGYVTLKKKEKRKKKRKKMLPQREINIFKQEERRRNRISTKVSTNKGDLLSLIFR